MCGPACSTPLSPPQLEPRDSRKILGIATTKNTCDNCEHPLCFVPMALKKVQSIGTPGQIGLRCDFGIWKEGTPP